MQFTRSQANCVAEYLPQYISSATSGITYPSICICLPRPAYKFALTDSLLRQGEWLNLPRAFLKTSRAFLKSSCMCGKLIGYSFSISSRESPVAWLIISAPTPNSLKRRALRSFSSACPSSNPSICPNFRADASVLK